MAAVDPSLVRDAVAGDPFASELVKIWRYMEQRPAGIDDASLQHIIHEAVAAGHREWRKLVQIETDRRWYRSAVLALAGVVLGYAACWLTHN